MQPKVSNFFKPSPSATAISTRRVDEEEEEEEEEEETDLSGCLRDVVDVSVTYTRRTPQHPQQRQQADSDDWGRGTEGMETGPLSSVYLGSSVGSGCSGKLLNKKRSYAEYHLEFGQSDFLVHTCSGCGMMCACGDESDEKLHKVHRKNCSEGVSFKGWCNEREIPTPWTDGERVMLVIDGDPPFQNVQQPITTAHRVISRAGSSKNFDRRGGNATKSAPVAIGSTTSKNTKALPTVLRFGNATFIGRAIKSFPPKTAHGMKECFYVLKNVRTQFVVFRPFGLLPPSEDAALPLGCWMQQGSNGSNLVRMATNESHCPSFNKKSFVANIVLETYQRAFSQPTSSGRAFAASYSGTPSFLVYKSQ